jgi:hypothetical protein
MGGSAFQSHSTKVNYKSTCSGSKIADFQVGNSVPDSKIAVIILFNILVLKSGIPQDHSAIEQRVKVNVIVLALDLEFFRGSVFVDFSVMVKRNICVIAFHLKRLTGTRRETIHVFFVGFCFEFAPFRDPSSRAFARRVQNKPANLNVEIVEIVISSNENPIGGLERGEL